jgi:hypothetical protein
MIKVDTSTIPNAGDGVFATEFIPSGTIICEYEGIKCSLAEDESDKSCTYIIDENNVVIGNGIGAKINDSVKFCKFTYEETESMFTKKILPLHHPHNCKFLLKDGKVFIVAISDIQPTNELFIDYGFKYWCWRILRNSLVDYRYHVSHFQF